VKLQVETWAAAEPELRSLFAAHYAAVGEEGSDETVDCPVMRQLNEGGTLLLITAREQELVGYLWAIICRNPIRSSRKEAGCTLFLTPESRSLPNARRLISFAETMLGAIGIEFIYIESRQKRDITPLLERLGYLKSGTIMEKAL